MVDKRVEMSFFCIYIVLWSSSTVECSQCPSNFVLRIRSLWHNTRQIVQVASLGCFTKPSLTGWERALYLFSLESNPSFPEIREHAHVLVKRTGHVTRYSTCFNQVKGRLASGGPEFGVKWHLKRGHEMAATELRNLLSKLTFYLKKIVWN